MPFPAMLHIPEEVLRIADRLEGAEVISAVASATSCSTLTSGSYLGADKLPFVGVTLDGKTVRVECRVCPHDGRGGTPERRVLCL